MVELLKGYEEHYDIDLSQLLGKGESVVIVDDSPEIVLILKHYLDKQGLSALHAGSASEFYQLLQKNPIALILLDIGLPDKSGIDILQDIVPKYPDLGIVMVTGTTNLDIALECLRLGADDYLTKPVGIEKLSHTVASTLKKRKLAIENRHFQQELEAAHNRTIFLHQLSLQMNSVYLSNVELKAILRAILVGITSEEGLKFNRAFLALFSDDGQILEGKLAIGTTCRAEAGRVWDSIRKKNLQLQDIISDDNGENGQGDVEVNRIINQLRVPVSNLSHILISAAINRQTIVVSNGSAFGCDVPDELLQILDHSSFVVVPLYSPSKSLGVLIVDNFVTHKQITQEEIHSLEIFASQASLAIEHSHLYEDMRIKIEELEMVNHELDRSKDLLVAAERYSAVGHMSAQLVHVIRNPITSIGGTARLLVKRTEDPYMAKFLKVISKEAAKVEATLEDLFSFVEERQLHLAPHQLYSLLRRCVMVFYTTMKNGNITYQLDLSGTSPVVQVDGDRIRQVFLHLIKNAIEAMPGGGVLFVGCTYLEDTEDGIDIYIKDSGTGIADNHLQLVTDPFFTTKTYGTGMGLTLVEKLTAMHGATFQLTRHEAGGMVAKVHLPSKMIVTPD